MVNIIRKALAGFILVSEHKELPPTPHRAPDVIFRGSALRGFAEKTAKPRVLLVKGHDEAEILRNLRSVVIENDAPISKAAAADGLNLVLFRGVFGSGGYDVSLKSARWEHGVIHIECEFE